MVERGNCTFVSKARYAELATAKMLIVIDDIEEKSESVVMVEDGHGNEIYIPTILIRKEDGELFKSYISDGDKVELLVSFVLKSYFFIIFFIHLFFIKNMINLIICFGWM